MSSSVFTTSNCLSVLLIEPFFGGSHKQLAELIFSQLSPSCKLFVLPATKWPWRARCSALYFAEGIPINQDSNGRTDFNVLFASSVLNLVELIALRPDLNSCRKIIYFHENQLTYPIQWWKDRDFQFGYNQILSCLVADEVLFNSAHNMESFLTSIDRFWNLMPDHRPKGIAERIRPKCSVLYYPIDFSNLPGSPKVEPKTTEPLHIVWPHRWEHDKDPNAFFSVLFKLQEEQLDFRVSVVGQTFGEVLPIFEEAKAKLADRIIQWSYCKEKSDYANVLSQADVVVSTAKHEFFGVAMLEAVHYGCYPLCPNRLVYPEIFPKECLYNTLPQLRKKLRGFCLRPHLARTATPQVDLARFSWETLKDRYKALFTVKTEVVPEC